MNELVCGRMKQGKTTFALWRARKHSPGVIVWDSRHMIEGACYVSDGESLNKAILAREWRKGAIVYRPDALAIKEDFADLTNTLFNPPQRFNSFSLVVDEAAQLQTSNSINPHLDLIVRQHPRGVKVIQTSHSLQDWYRASKDLMNDLFCFRLIGRSLKAVIEFCDGDEMMESTIRNLPDHHILHYSFAGDGEFDVISDSESWYSDVTARADTTREKKKQTTFDLWKGASPYATQ